MESVVFFCLQINRNGKKPPHRTTKPIQPAIAYTRPRRDSLWYPRLPPCEQKRFSPQGPKPQRQNIYLNNSLRPLASLRLVFFRLFQLPDSTPDRREPLLIAFPRIRVIRLESLPRARRGGPRHPVRKLIRFAIAYTRRTHKSVCPLLPGCAEGH